MKIARTLALAGSFALVGSSSLFAADEAKPADPKAQPKITFDEHIVPIFREHCLSCHNQNEAKSDLALDTYARTMAGGAGGEVVVAGDIDSSRLYALVAHTETPKMPPSQDRIADAKVEWKSSDEAIAKVENGTVTGVAGGAATLTLTAKKLTATVNVTVSAGGPAAIAVDPATAEIKVNGTHKIAVKATDAAGAEVAGVVYTFATSDAAICTVDPTGAVTGVAAGDCKVTVSEAGGKSAEVAVTVAK